MNEERQKDFQDYWHTFRRWLPFLLLGTVILGAVITVFFLTSIYRSVPEYAELRDIRHHEASTVYTADGEILGRYYLQNRDNVSFQDVSSGFMNALLAIEDVRFYEHSGIDYRAIGRVFVRTLLLRQDAGGGSTITQQLAKNLYPRERHGSVNIVADKLREMMIAYRMERIYSKEEILELYVNTVSFGEDTWGIKTASERFFNSTPAELELHQAATLAGMLRATTFYNPRRNPGNALQRRNLVIWQMERYGMIDAEMSQETRDLPLDLDYNRFAQSEGSAPHFRQHLRAKLHQILATHPTSDGRYYNLNTDGLRVETTIDSRLQSSAEYAVETQLSGLQALFDRHRDHEPVFDEHDPMVYRAWYNSGRYEKMKERGYPDEEIMEALDEPVSMDLFTWEGMETVTASPRDSIRHYLSFLNAGFVAMDPSTGEVKAWVGGIPHRQFQYDHVRARRQTGSAFKPVVYAAALESGTRPCDYRRNLLSTYRAHDEWTPSNIQEEYGGHYSIQAALSRSVNTISVELMMETGIETVIETARRMGIDSYIPSEPSVALGTAEISLLEMTRAYTAFLNRGIPANPRFITAIYNSDGDLIYDFRKPLLATGFDGTELAPELPVGYDVAGSAGPAVTEETAATMVSMLSRTVNGGSASALRSQFGITHAIAGKTGTTQNFSDGWFIGMTPDLVFGTWVGGTTPRVQMPEHAGFASQTALPVAGLFLQRREQAPGLDPIPNQFHEHQMTSVYPTDCSDYRDERFTDRVRDFFSGRDSGEAQIVDDEDESRSVIGRVRGWFSSN